MVDFRADSQWYKNLNEINLDDFEENRDFEKAFNLNYVLLDRLYKDNNYDFTDDELLKLINDLKMLECSRFEELLYFAKERKNEYIKNNLNKVLLDEYNKTIIEKDLLTTFITLKING